MVNLNDPRELYYVRQGTTLHDPNRNLAAQQRFARGVLTLVPIGKGAQLSWRAGQGLARFAKRGGFYHTRRAGGKAVGYYRRASARVRRPIRGSRTYGRISRRLPFYKSRQRVRAATDLAADAGVVYYGGRRVYRKTRSLGARSRTPPTRTAYSQHTVPVAKRPPRPNRPGGKGWHPPHYTRKSSSRGKRRPRSQCKPGYYYNYKAGKCLKSKY